MRTCSRGSMSLSAPRQHLASADTCTADPPWAAPVCWQHVMVRKPSSGLCAAPLLVGCGRRAPPPRSCLAAQQLRPKGPSVRVGGSECWGEGKRALAQPCSCGTSTGLSLASPGHRQSQSEVVCSVLPVARGSLPPCPELVQRLPEQHTDPRASQRGRSTGCREPDEVLDLAAVAVRGGEQ